MNHQLIPDSPQHLRHHQLVEQWVDAYQAANRWPGVREDYPDCRRCGWPHSQSLLCGMGTTFGQVRLGGQWCYIDSSNVEYILRFVEHTLPALGFHWKHDVRVARIAGDVVISRVEFYNNTPHISRWTIPVAEFASIVCAASATGETAQQYQDVLSLLTVVTASPAAPVQQTQRFTLEQAEAVIHPLEANPTKDHIDAEHHGVYQDGFDAAIEAVVLALRQLAHDPAIPVTTTPEPCQ